MRQRIISALIGLVVLAVALAVLDTVFFNILVGAIGALALWELLQATKCTEFGGLSVLCLLIAAAIPFAQEQLTRTLMPPILFTLILLFFLALLRYHAVLRVEQATMMFFFAVFVPLFFSCAVYIRNGFGATVGGLYLLWALGSGWLSDTGAYFFGLKFGKHKLAPVISPKKTIEGAIGGGITATVVMLLLAFAYQMIMAWWGVPIHVNYWLMLVFTPVLAVVGMLGDLSASVIKRQYGVKDYGNIMPGHGGIMDRFDSVLFTIPAVFIVVCHVAVVTLA